MSFNGSGVWIAPTPVVAGTTIRSDTYNSNNTDIKSGFDNTVTRDGQGVMTGPFKIVDGTSSAPGIAFNGESSTGMFRPSAGVLALSSSGVQVAQLNSNGHVLVGTTTDDGTNVLQVGGAAAVSGALTLSSTLAVTGATTLAALTVSGAAVLSSTLNVTGGASAASYSPTGTSVPGAGLYAPAANVIALSTAGVERLRVDATGNIGINTTPSAWGSSFRAIELNGLSLASTTTGSTAYVANNDYINSSAQHAYKTSAASSMYAQNAGTHQFYVAPSGTAGSAITYAQALTIDNSGNVCVGASPTGKFSVTGSVGTVSVTSDGAHLNFSRPSVNYIGATDAGGYLALQTANTTQVTIDTAGNLGLGVSPDAWAGSFTAFQMDSGALMSADIGTGVYLMQNTYYNGSGNYVYKTTNKVSNYTQNNGMHLFGVAPSGTAGSTATITYPVAIDNNGNLLVGTTSSLWNSAGRGVVEINGTSTALLGLKINGANGGYLYHDGTNLNLVNSKSGSVLIGGSLEVTTGGVIQDVGGHELGYKGVPQTTSGWVNGQCYQVSAGVTVNTSVAGYTYCIFNNSASSVTLTQGTGLTLRLNGTSSTGNRTLLQYGLATVMFISPTVAVISGAVA